MKRIGWMAVCLAVVAALAMCVPAEAGRSKGGSKGGSVYVPNTKCVIAFASAFPKVLNAVVACADPGSISISYDIDAAHLNYAAKICFRAQKDGKVDKYRCRKSCWYCLYVRCGKVEYCNQTNGEK